jgi:hypothetical protein
VLDAGSPTRPRCFLYRTPARALGLWLLDQVACLISVDLPARLAILADLFFPCRFWVKLM